MPLWSISLHLLSFIDFDQTLEEIIQLVNIKLLVDVDIVLMLDRNGMIFALLYHLSVNCGSSVHHDLKLESRWIAHIGIKVFKQPEHEPRHEVQSQYGIELLSQFQI